MSFQPDREELAWAAGFFDGEGHTCFSKRPGAKRADGTSKRFRRVDIDVRQCHTEVLERFQRAVAGIGRINGPYGPYGSRPKSSPHWYYQAAGFPQAQAVIAMLWPFLGSVKREQAAKALRSYRESR